MVLTLQGHEPCARNSSGKLATSLKWPRSHESNL